MKQTIKSYVSARILPKFSVSQGMDEATVARLYGAGLSDLRNEKLVHELWSNFDHSLMMYPKTIPSLPYEALITLFSKYDKSKIHKTIRNLSSESLLHIANASRATLLAVREVALEDGNAPQHGFIFQHVGPRDALPKASFNTSYLPLHLHIQLYGYDLDGFELFRQGSPIDLETPEYASLLSDPAAMIAKDMLEAVGYRVERRGNTAVEFNKKAIDEPFTRSEMREVRALQVAWMKSWDKLAACFTDFKKDEFGRYLLYDKQLRLANIEKYLSQNRILQDESKNSLLAIASDVECNTSDPWRWTYMGVNGVAGYAFDFNDNTRSFRFSPKIFTSSYRHFDIVGQDFIIVKDKNSEMMGSASAANQVLEIQRRIIGKLTSNAHISSFASSSHK